MSLCLYSYCFRRRRRQMLDRLAKTLHGSPPSAHKLSQFVHPLVGKGLASLEDSR